MISLEKTPIEGLLVARSRRIEDDRGAFARVFCEKDLELALGDRGVKQANISVTKSVGAVRGMHYQVHPHAETKIVRCVSGKVFDVAVDLRAGSPTFLQWYGIELEPENGAALIIPEGCGHGFQVLAPDAALLYLHTEFYTPNFEGGVRYDDPRIAIEWPMHVSQVSERDKQHSLLKETYEGLIV